MSCGASPGRSVSPTGDIASSASTLSGLNFDGLEGNSVQDHTAFEDLAPLSRHGTLLSSGATTVRRAAELKALLGNANSRLRPGALISQHSRREPTSFEQAKPRARVEIDIVLHSNVCVEGGVIKGFIKLRIRPRLAKESPVSISDGKLRIIGFESTENNHHEFFQYSAPLSAVVTSPPTIFQGCGDSKGFWAAREGVHKLEFEMHLPINGPSRPKGPLYGQSGVAVRYIALASIKVKDELDKRSIAHFYRDCTVWPRLNPSVVLAPSEQSIRATTTKRLFMGGNGEVKLTAALHRPYFIAGTQVSVNISVQNDSKKLIKSLALTLYRSIVVFKQKLGRDPEDAAFDVADPDACQTNTTRKPVATSTLEMAQGFSRGHASTSGWWPGIPSGERSEISHLLLIPPDALTHTRERLIEVEYTIRVSLNTGSLTPDVCVTLPIRIINLLSLDPPPIFTLDETPSQSANSVAENAAQLSGSDTQYQLRPESDCSDLDEGFQESDSEDNPGHEAQLGNISMCEDAEDLVQHAIVSAQMDDRSETAVRFPESIDEGLSPADAECLEELPEEEPEKEDASNFSQAELPASRPTRPRGPSSFALRVQNKLQVAAIARNSVVPDDLGLEETEATLDPPTGPTRHTINSTDICLDVPPRSVISCASGYQVASSSFLDDRYFGSVSQSEPDHPPPPRSRLLPRPPSIVGLPFPETAGIVYAAGPAASREDVNRPNEGTYPPEELKPKRPLIAPGASASSVKAKIKELEERVRAAEGH